MNDIGLIQYSKNISKNIIEAKWSYLKNGASKSGTGIVRGTFEDTFAGDFHVTYYDAEGKETTNFQLNIRLEAGHYQLQWIKDRTIEYIGIGYEYDNKLFAGWRKYVE